MPPFKKLLNTKGGRYNEFKPDRLQEISLFIYNDNKMIDYIKIMNLPVLLPDIIKNPYLNFGTSVNIETGEILGKPQTAKYKGISFFIKKNKRTNEYQYINLEGSIHKYWNNGEHNYNDFNFNNLGSVINELSEKFNLDPSITRLNNIEFGVNLKTPFNPDVFLKSIINHKGKQFSIIRQKNKHFRECEHTRYYFKIYNKGLQFNKNSILRVEVKITRMEQLKKVGIVYLSDLLDYNKYLLLGAELRTYYNDLLIFDSRVSFENIKLREHIILTEGVNPEYWENLKKSNPDNYYKKRLRFIELSEKYGATKIKSDVYNLLDKKIKELSEIKPETLQELTGGKLQKSNKTLQELTGGENQNITGINTSTIRLIPSLLLPTEKRFCTVTKIDISNQKERSNFLSENTIYKLFSNDRLNYLKLERKYLNNSKFELSIKEKCYFIAHNIRNSDSNKRNNLFRQIKRYENENSLFNTEKFLQLNNEQKQLIDGTY